MNVSVGDRWLQTSTGFTYVVTRVGKRKITMTCRRPTFDIKVSAWLQRLGDDADWRPVYWCPDCGAMATHRATCTMFPGEPVVHGNRTPPPADIAARLRFAIDNTVSF